MIPIKNAMNVKKKHQESEAECAQSVEPCLPKTMSCGSGCT